MEGWVGNARLRVTATMNLYYNLDIIYIARKKMADFVCRQFEMGLEFVRWSFAKRNVFSEGSSEPKKDTQVIRVQGGSSTSFFNSKYLFVLIILYVICVNVIHKHSFLNIICWFTSRYSSCAKIQKFTWEFGCINYTVYYHNIGVYYHITLVYFVDMADSVCLLWAQISRTCMWTHLRTQSLEQCGRLVVITTMTYNLGNCNKRQDRYALQKFPGCTKFHSDVVHN